MMGIAQGVKQALVFATLISLLPKLVGREHAANTIGYVVGATGVGLAILPSLGGILAEALSLEAIIPFILGLCLVLVLLFELLMRQHTALTADRSGAGVNGRKEPILPKSIAKVGQIITIQTYLSEE